MTGRSTQTATRDDECSAHRALVPVHQAEPNDGHSTAASMPAPFLAHLIATAEALPQTRQRRRAQPGEAVALYRACAARLNADS